MNNRCQPETYLLRVRDDDDDDDDDEYRRRRGARGAKRHRLSHDAANQPVM